MEKKHKQIAGRVKKRLLQELNQNGGGCIRGNCFNSSGSFVNMVKQLSYFIGNSVVGITDGIDTVYSIVTLPSDLGHNLGKPSEPLPSNTPIAKLLKPPEPPPSNTPMERLLGKQSGLLQSNPSIARLLGKI